MGGVRSVLPGGVGAGEPDQELASAIAERVASLTLEEKIQLLTAPDFSRLRSLAKIGLKELVVSDGPSGVRGRHWDERDPSQNIPCSSALGATWDEDMVERMGAIMGHDAREKGVDISLAPCVNLQRSLYAGRHFEYFSEDPLLTGRLGAGYVRGLQKTGVAATVKHFVANDSETERMTADVVVDERTMREVYMTPFEIIVREAEPWLVMSSYNLVNGESMSESHTLRDVLKEEWGFDGLVMSDFLATPPTVAAAAGGLDIAMPWPKGGPRGPWNELLKEAVGRGELAEATLDDKIVRLLRLAYRCGALEGFPGKAPAPLRDKAGEARDLRAAAAASFVLARNTEQLLPLDRKALSSIAVIGPNCQEGRANGGGSAKVYPVHVVSPLEGISGALSDGVRLLFAEGVRPFKWHAIARAPWLRQADDDGEGVRVDFLDGDGVVLASERRNTGEFAWTVHFATGVDTAAIAWVRVTGRIVAQESGTHSVGISGVGHYRFGLDGQQAFEVHHKLRPGADITEGFTFPPQRMCSVELDQGQGVDIEITHEVGTFRPGSPLSMFQIRLATPFGDEEEELEKAVAFARAADAAIVVLGNDSNADAEGIDRPSLGLPGRQDELVRRVVEANPRTIVVLNAAGPVILPWAEEVPAILLAWLPGQELGNALADVLFGEQEPGGRLPMTWPRDECGVAPVKPVDGTLLYSEGLFVGYRGYDRGGRAAQYEFGHGLGYTTWDYVAVDAPVDAPVCEGAGAGESVIVVRVRNTGVRTGRETVQVYLSKPESEVERPLRWLAGFAMASVAPGEEVAVPVTVPATSFRHWTCGGWRVEPGKYVAHVGRSSRDLRLSAEIEVT